jgi:hypothetical protein
MRGGARLARRVQAVRDRGEQILAVALCLALVGTVASVVLGSSEPPRDPEDVCAVFREKPRWHDAARASAQRWGVSEGALLAIVFQESSFRAHARPARTLWLGILPGFRLSSAYGFGQILDATWQEYLDSGVRPGARRNRMTDVLDFIGWYGMRIEQVTGVPRTSVRDLYLAYHEGPGGYVRGDWKGKPRLIRIARRVEARARRYDSQYAGCRAGLEHRSWLPFL